MTKDNGVLPTCEDHYEKCEANGYDGEKECCENMDCWNPSISHLADEFIEFVMSSNRMKKRLAVQDIHEIQTWWLTKLREMVNRVEADNGKG